MNDLSCWETKFKYCCYSKRLLTKLLLLNENLKYKIDILEIKKAIYYAKKYHGDQKRQSGEPYYSHPLEVAFMIADYKPTTNVLVTSILHDVIEDTNLTRKMIEHIFGTIIASQVEDLTRVKSNKKISSTEMIKLLWNQKKEDLLLIKYFDRLHNMQTIKAKSSDKITRITEETLKQFFILSIYLVAKIPALLMIEEQMTSLCYQNIPSMCPPYGREQFVLEDNFQLAFPAFQND